MEHNILHRMVLSAMLLLAGLQLSAGTGSYVVGPSRLPLWKDLDVNGAVVSYAAHGASIKVEKEETSGWMYVEDTSTGEKGWTLKEGLAVPGQSAMTPRQYDSLMVKTLSFMNVNKGVVSYYEKESGYYLDDDGDLGCGKERSRGRRSGRREKSGDGTFWITLLALVPALLPAGALFVLSLNYSADQEKKKAVKSRKLPIWGIVMLLLQASVFVGYYLVVSKVVIPSGEIVQGSSAGAASGGFGWIWAIVVAAVVFLILFCSGVMRFHTEMYGVYDLRSKPVILSGAVSFIFLSTTVSIAAGIGVYYLLNVLGVNDDISTGAAVALAIPVFLAMPLLSMRKAILKQNPEARSMVGLLVVFDILAIVVGIVIALLALAFFIFKTLANMLIGGGTGIKGLGYEDMLGGASHCGSCEYFGTSDCPYHITDGHHEACSHHK